VTAQLTPDELLVAWHAAFVAHGVRVDEFVWWPEYAVPYRVRGAVAARVFQLCVRRDEAAFMLILPCKPLGLRPLIGIAEALTVDGHRRNPRAPEAVLADALGRVQQHAQHPCIPCAKAST
jgi:hypothetical protein